MAEQIGTVAPKTMHTTHNKYYHDLKAEAYTRILSLFETNGTNMGEIIHKTKIENADDIEVLLAFVLKHGDPMSIAHILRYQTDWQHACNELHEHHD